MRPSHLLCLCLLPVPLLALAGPQPPAAPPAGKADEKTPGLAPPTAEELAGKRLVFMKAALSRFTVRVGNRKEVSAAADPCRPPARRSGRRRSWTCCSG